MDEKVLKHIEVVATKVATNLKMQYRDRENLQQELTIKALEAIPYYDDKKAASLATYQIVAINRSVKKLANMIIAKKAKWIEDMGDDAKDIPLPEIELMLSLDIAITLDELKVCDRRICEMLMAGYTKSEIARELEISKVKVSQIVGKLKKSLEKIK